MTAPLRLMVAHDQNRLIGLDNDLPWRLPEDLKRFKALTLGGIVLMGRATWDSLPRKPLPERENWVISRNSAFAASGARCFSSLGSALAAPRSLPLWVIGGGQIYQQALPLADELFITLVHARIATEGHASTVMADYAALGFVKVSTQPHPADERHAYPYSFEHWLKQ